MRCVFIDFAKGEVRHCHPPPVVFAGPPYFEWKVLGINGGALTADDIKSQWRGSIPCKIVDCNDKPRIGGILNKILLNCNGEYIARIDADDLYLPNYVRDRVCCCELFDADFMGITSNFRFFSHRNALSAKVGDNIFQTPVSVTPIPGGAQFYKRSVLRQVTYNESIILNEDVQFAQMLQLLGKKVIVADPFNFVQVRSGDLADHTWTLDDYSVQIGRNSCYAGTSDEMVEYVEF